MIYAKAQVTQYPISNIKHPQIPNKQIDDGRWNLTYTSIHEILNLIHKVRNKASSKGQKCSGTRYTLLTCVENVKGILKFHSIYSNCIILYLYNMLYIFSQWYWFLFWFEFYLSTGLWKVYSFIIFSNRECIITILPPELKKKIICYEFRIPNSVKYSRHHSK